METLRAYRIIRFFKKSGRQKTIRRGLSREEAQAWCRREDTHKPGVWFDGFDLIEGVTEA